MCTPLRSRVNTINNMPIPNKARAKPVKAKKKLMIAKIKDINIPFVFLKLNNLKLKTNKNIGEKNVSSSNPPVRR